jgi:hypothetical protein
VAGLDHRFGHGGTGAEIGHRATEARRMPENRIFSALRSVPPWLCGNIPFVMAETTIKAVVAD